MHRTARFNLLFLLVFLPVVSICFAEKIDNKNYAQELLDKNLETTELPSSKKAKKMLQEKGVELPSSINNTVDLTKAIDELEQLGDAIVKDSDSLDGLDDTVDLDLQAIDFVDPTMPADFDKGVDIGQDTGDESDSPEEPLRVRAIFQAKDRKVAIINGKVLREGEMVRGKKIIKIDKTSVTVWENGITSKLSLPNAIVKGEVL